MESKLADFHLWNYSLSESQLNALSCEDEGNIVNPSNMQYSADAELTQITYEDFECGESVSHHLRLDLAS